MNREELKRRILEVIKESAEIERELDGTVRIIEDLCLSSMEIMVLIMDIEREFKINIPKVQMGQIETLDDFCDMIIRELCKA